MPSLIIRKAAFPKTGKEYVLQIRRAHMCETEYIDVAYVDFSTADELTRSGEPEWHMGKIPT